MTMQRFENFLMIIFSALIVMTMVVSCTPAENEGAPQTDPTAISEPTVEATEATADLPTDPQVDTIENQLIGTKWDLVSMNGESSQTDITLSFMADSVNGSDGCNNYFSDYTIAGGTITFAGSGRTEMACMNPDVDVMGIADRYVEMLNTASAFTLDNDSLVIETDGGELVFSEPVSAELTNTRWQLTGLNNGTGGIVSMANDADIYFTIDGGMVSGNGGCNGFGGEVTIEGDTITFGNLISTMMACPEDDKTQREAEFLAALPNAVSYEIVRQALSLFDADGNLVASFVASEETEQMEGETKTFFVGAEQVECVGVAPQKCLLVKENIDDDYTFFYDNIDGFEWEAGFEYELLVNVTDVENPPADASSLSYELIEIVSKTEVATTGSEQADINNSSWNLLHLIIGGDAVVFAPDGADVTLEITDESVSGNAGCNSFSGSAEIDGDSISFGPLATTRMACGETLDQFESGMLELFANVTRYEVKENGALVLSNNDLRLAEFVQAGAMPGLGLPGSELEGTNMSHLVGTSWQWTAFQDTADINSIEVADPSLFVLTFNGDGSYGLVNDCNVGGGEYALDGSSLTFLVGIATQAYCGDDSLDQELSRLLPEVVTYMIKGGQLYLNLKLDSGNLVFSPVP